MKNFWKSKTGIATAITIGVTAVFTVIGWIFFTPKTTTYAPQTQENSPNSLQIQANEINITKDSSPTLTYEMDSPSQKEGDGLYRTVFNLRLIYSPGTLIEGNITDQDYLSCGNVDPKNISTMTLYNGTQYSGMLQKVFSVSCTSAQPITDNGNLFHYVP